MEQPIPLAQFALELKKSGVDYHEYGFSKLIKLLQSQNIYIAIEGAGTDKYIKLINSPSNKHCIKEQRLLIEQEMSKPTYVKCKSHDIPDLLHDIYLGHIASLVKELELMVGSKVSLDYLAESYKLAKNSESVQLSDNTMSFFTGFQHLSKGEIYMGCVANYSHPWKYDSFFYLAQSNQQD